MTIAQEWPSRATIFARKLIPMTAAFLCRLGFHPRTRSARYLGMAKNSRRNWLGQRIYKAFLDEFECGNCARIYRRWS